MQSSDLYHSYSTRDEIKHVINGEMVLILLLFYLFLQMKLLSYGQFDGKWSNIKIIDE